MRPSIGINGDCPLELGGERVGSGRSKKGQRRGLPIYEPFSGAQDSPSGSLTGDTDTGAHRATLAPFSKLVPLA